MKSSDPTISLESFQTFGDLLKYLRRRARLTQRELSIAVKYSEAQISRLEQNQRPPDMAALIALFVPALYLDEEPAVVARLLELAAQARGETVPQGGTIMFSHSGREEIRENVRVIEHVPSNLPLQLTSFVGREREMAEIKRLLTSNDDPIRLVTLTGPGGMGKTRLAFQTTMGLSHLYRDGIWLVDLSPLSTSELIPQTVATNLNIKQDNNQSIEESLITGLRAKQILILMDNCEHLIHAAAELVQKILRTCAGVQILATSREPLHVPGEVIFQVPTLTLPKVKETESQSVLGHESVRLFIERARAVHPSFVVTDSNAKVIAHICRKLDGLPLAIELAAARVSVLSVNQIEARLEDRFRLLTSGQTALPRHQTLRSTLEWSHDMLSEAEEVLFRRLSVFAGGWKLEAANAVCADQNGDSLDTLAQLVNKSLVVVENLMDIEARYRMLETIREFARDQLLASGEVESMRARHFDYFLGRVQQAEPRLFAAESSIDWAESEMDNMRAALTWALEKDSDGAFSQERTGRGLDLMLHVWPLWLQRGYALEGNEWLNQLLSVHTAPTLARSRALLLAGDLAGLQGDYEGQAAYIWEALALARQLGDPKRIAWGLMEMGGIEGNRHRYPEAVKFLTESLEMFRELKEDLWVCRTSFLLAQTHMANGNLETAESFWEQGLDLSRVENDEFHIAWGLEGLGNLERLKGRLEQARQLYTESLNLKVKVSVMDKVGVTYSLAAFAQLAATRNQFQHAARLWGAAEKLRQSLHLLPFTAKEQLYTSLISAARARLGEEIFAAAWAEGREMTMQEAIEYALALTTG